MPSSVVSSEPLSSPVSSPSPPPQAPRASTSTNNGAPVGIDSGSELSELTDDEQESTHRNTNREERPGPTKKRKRSQIIPTPMWGWAYADGKVPREEEEEEHAGPARAMEEEEDDDDRDSRPRTGSSSQRRRTRTASGPPPVLKSDDERDFDLDDAALSADEADDLPVRGDDADDGEDISEDEEKETAADVELGENAPDSRAKLGADAGSADDTDEDNLEDDEGEPLGDDDQAEDDKTTVGLAVAESEDEADDVPLPRPVVSPTVPAPAPAAVTIDRKVDPVSTFMDVDDTAPVATQVSPIIAAAAASSIMARAAVVDPPSPSASTSNASEPRNASRSPTRSPTPEVVSDREVPVKRGAVKTRAKPKNARRSRRRVKADAGLEQDADPVPTPLDAEDPDADPDDPDMDSPEMDMELDLQPAHRAEALDVLATIELKYAMLRESLYVEKMEALAWEEALVAEGTHPEMIHLQAELSKRRDKRLELARRRRDYEVVNVTKRRKLDDDGVWSWWKLRRDELQTEMISDAQRKRRQIERDKRASERPQPIRRIPSPPREVQPAPTLRDLVKSSPYDLPESRRRPTAPASLSYPQLSTLPQNEITSDLEYLYAHRRIYGHEAANARIGMGPLVGHSIPGPPPFEPYNIGMGMLDGPGAPGRFPSYLSLQQGPLLHTSLPPQIMQGYPNAGHAPRMQHHHSAPPVPHPHPQLMVDQDITVNHRAAAPHSNMHMQHPPPGGPIPLMRRSISPVPVSSNGLSSVAGPSSFGSSKSSSRAILGGPGPGSLSLKDGRRTISGTRNVDMDIIDREKERDRMFETMKSREHADRDWPMDREHERERIREREREREYERGMDRSNHIPHTLQRHQHAHQHGSSGGPANHVHGAHHHHVYHHHPGGINGQGPSFAGSNGMTSGDMSPLHIHEHEAQRQHLGVPVEVIELSSSTKSRRSSHSSSRKGREDLPPLADTMRERGRIGPGIPPYERTSSSFVQGNFPPSPHAPAGMSTAPASMAPSRRGSWSAPDETGMPRPASSSSNHPSLPPPHRVSSSASLSNRPQLSPTLRPHHSPSLLSPPRSNGIRLPPLSPPQGSNVRSPVRGPQGLPGPAVHPSGSSSKSVSPKVTRRTPPPSSSSGRPKSPSSRERSHSGTQPSIIPLSQKLSRMSPANLPSPPIPQSTAHPPSRLSNVGMESDSNLIPAQKVKAVPVD